MTTNNDFGAQAVKVFKALADPTRYEMVRMLVAYGEVSCQAFQETFELSPSALSHHYRVLENAGLTVTRREKQYLFHRLNREALERFLPRFVEIHGVPAIAAPGHNGHPASAAPA
jgi:DNA-binding transcriptional ArsR family regulator